MQEKLNPLGSFGIIDITVMEEEMCNPPMPLPHAYIWVTELNQGACTDLRGRFIIGPVPPGKYTIRALKNDYVDGFNYPVPTIVVPIRQPGGRVPVIESTLWLHGQP
jgi:hypothetical protein